jgi:hypothetical protein
MSRLTRVLLLAVLLAAMTLAGGAAVAQERTTEATQAAALRRVLAQEHSYTFGQPPAATTSPVRPAAPEAPSDRPLVALGVPAAALALAGALVVLARRRAGRGVRARQAA